MIRTTIKIRKNSASPVFSSYLDFIAHHYFVSKKLAQAMSYLNKTNMMPIDVSWRFQIKF